MLKHLVVGSVILFGSNLLAGCGVNGNLTATPTGNRTYHISGTVHTSGISTPSSAATPTSEVNPSQSSSPSSPTTPVSQSSPQTTSPSITLESIQVTNGGVILTTTHGTMQTAYQNPHILSGSHQVFEMTLVNASAGNLPVNHTQTITTNWGTTEEIIPQGRNLLLAFDLKPTIHQFQISIGAGTIIQVAFR